MEFFNKKEEVIEIELTRIGREKLSKGSFIPAYYEFVDDDIIYDIKNVSPDAYEEQNNIKTRIKDSLKLKPSTAIQKVVNYSMAPKIENKPIESLGTFSPYTNYMPAWEINAIDGTLFTGSGNVSYRPIEVGAGLTVGPSFEKIPQLALTCSYDYTFFNNAKSIKAVMDALDENALIEDGDIFKNNEDDSFIIFKKSFNDFTIQVSEDNIISGKEDFEIEFFKYSYSNNFLTASINQLYFDEENINENSVEWYFNFATDGNISREGFEFVDEPIIIETPEDECV